MNKRWGTPETSVQIRLMNNKGEEYDVQDCVAGISFESDGVISFDLRNLRPLRVLDRNCLIIEMDVHDVLTAIADYLEKKSTS